MQENEIYLLNVVSNIQKRIKNNEDKTVKFVNTFTNHLVDKHNVSELKAREAAIKVCIDFEEDVSDEFVKRLAVEIAETAIAFLKAIGVENPKIRTEDNIFEFVNFEGYLIHVASRFSINYENR